MRLKFTFVVALAATIMGCSGSGSSTSPSSGGGSSTWSLDGELDFSSSLASVEKPGLKSQMIDMALKTLNQFSGSGSIQSGTQCADGMYYRIACLSWSVPPEAYEAAVNCADPTSGVFTVPGLPLNADITCLVRQSATSTGTYTNFGTIELAAPGLTGSTDTISSGADMQISVPVTDAGIGIASVTSGTNDASERVGNVTVNATSLSGFYGSTCSSAITAQEQIECKCFLSYEAGGYADPDTCIADGAADITTGALDFYINVAEATASGDVDLNGDATPELVSGQKMYVGSIWGAQCSSTTAASCVSNRGNGAEGLPDSSVIPNLTWSPAASTTAISWAFPAVAGGDDCEFIPTNMQGAGGIAVPSNSANRAAWLNWYRKLMEQYQINASSEAAARAKIGGNCSAGSGDIWSDIGCYFAFRDHLRSCAEGQPSGARVPAVQINGVYDSTGAQLPPTDAKYISISGLSFASDGSSDGGPGASPFTRYATDIFVPNSDGTGGSLTAWGEDTRTMQCTNTPTQPYHTDQCPGSDGQGNGGGDGGLNCYGGRELKLRLVPRSGNNYSMIFKEEVHFYYVEIQGRGITTPTTEEYNQAAQACRDYLFDEASPDFVLDLVKKTE